jgi:hypothetical protein
VEWAKSNNVTSGKCAKLWYFLYLSSNFSPKLTIKIKGVQRILALEHIHIELTKNGVRFGREIADTGEYFGSSLVPIHAETIQCED